MTLPNRLSFFRLGLGIFIPYLILWPAGQLGLGRAQTLPLAVILFIIGTITDFYDGWLARRHHLESEIGRILDPLADKVFILGAMTGFAMRGVYSYWFLFPFYLREVAITFCRVAWLWQGHAVGAERVGKLKLGLQVTSVSFTFLYLYAPSPYLYKLNAFFLGLALIMTLVSGYLFLRNNAHLLKDTQFCRMVGTLGVGYLRPAPGTYGTLLGMAILPAISHDPLLHLLVFVTFLLIGYISLSHAAYAKEDDPLEVVIDEVCGILLTFWLIPLTWKSLLIGFLAFRFFDVTKLFPIRWLEGRKGVHGILWDDLGAGVYSWLVLKILGN